MTAADALDAALLSLAHRGERTPCMTTWGHISDDPHERAAVLHTCDACPIRQQCGAAADERHERFGVWAGSDRTPRGRVFTDHARPDPPVERVSPCELKRSGGFHD